MNIELYPHNQETYSKIYEMWKSTNRVAAVQATGTGKSFIILKLIYDYPKKKKVILAPTDFIFTQLEKYAGESLANTQFLTYTKLFLMSDEDILALDPDMIFLDEFHRGGAEKWELGVQKLLSYFPNAKVLGTSATPIRYLDNGRDMVDELFEGNIVANLSLAEAIVRGILPMPQYVSALYTLEHEIEKLRDKVKKSSNTIEQKKELINQINRMKRELTKSKGIPVILKKYIKKHNGKFIVFCRDVDHLKEMQKTVVEWFDKADLATNISIYTVYYGYAHVNREFEDFKNDSNSEHMKLLFCVDMLNEGIHISDIDGVFLVRPTISKIIYYQQIGRAIDAGQTGVPLIFDFVNNFESIGATQFYEDLKLIADKVMIERDRNDIMKEYEVPEFKIFDEIQDIKIFVENTENQLYENWDAQYIKLKQFYDSHGHCNIEKGYHDKKLYIWCKTQRVQNNKQSLSKVRIDLLNAIGFEWKPLESAWERRYNQLVKFKEENGKIVVPKQQKDLYTWVCNMKIEYKQGNLSKERIEKLEAIGFIFNRFQYQWDAMYERLRSFIEKYGHCKVTCSVDSSLYDWIRSNMDSYAAGRLCEERIEKLSLLGFEFATYPIDKTLSIYHIKNLMRAKKITNPVLANILNVSRGRLYCWYANQNNIPYKYVLLLADYFKVQPEQIQPQAGDGCIPDRTNRTYSYDYGLSPYHIKNLFCKSNKEKVELTRYLGITHSSVNSWCKGKNNISQKYLKKVAEFFGVDIDLIEPQSDKQFRNREHDDIPIEAYI